MSGGGEDVRKRAMRREQSVKKVDWSVAVRIGEAIRDIWLRGEAVPDLEN